MLGSVTGTSDDRRVLRHGNMRVVCGTPGHILNSLSRNLMHASVVRVLVLVLDEVDVLLLREIFFRSHAQWYQFSIVKGADHCGEHDAAPGNARNGKHFFAQPQLCAS